MREADAVEQVEHERPEDADLAASRLRGRRNEQASTTRNREEAADDHLADLVRLAPLETPPLPKSGNSDEHREAHSRVEGDQPAAGQGRAHDTQVELLITPDEIGVENLLVGQQRDRHHRDQDTKSKDAESVSAIEIARQEP